MILAERPFQRVDEIESIDEQVRDEAEYQVVAGRTLGL